MSPTENQDSENYHQILGIRFFDGTAKEAVAFISHIGGLVVVPAAPALVKLQSDADFRAALTSADLAIADSGLMVLLWRLLRGQTIPRLSGLTYLKQLLELPEIATRDNAFWIVPSKSAEEKAFNWLRQKGFSVSESDFYVAPYYGHRVEDGSLVASLEKRKPKHIIIAIGGGPQEKLGRYLREHLSYRPAIHCIGAALGFLTGDQIAIPDWADRFYLGWMLRLFAQPRIFVPRLGRALELPLLIARYGSELPPLRDQSRK
jgi:N-acetylglucosaminyldiphosphoundecaprenol N-acetyl-beta-D-mannosaminyltransferase